VIRCDGLRKHFELEGGAVFEALRGVSLQIGAGEMVAVTGASGSGKSTWMNLIGALDRPSEGEVFVGGVALSSMPETALAHFRNRQLGFVFQQFNLLARHSAVANVELPLMYAGRSRADRRARAMELLERLGVEEHAAKRPAQMSGGQQQRVAIARALACDAPLLLADEPTGALDSATGAAVLDLLKALNAEGRTVVVVTHDPAVAERCDRRIRFADGVVVEDSSW
jgi:putative ABC transport system ATP-binding protein